MSQRNGAGKSDQVIDFNSKREERLQEKRRKTERIFFKHLLGIYCVTGNSEMQQVEFVDVSEEGCSFQVPFTDNVAGPKEKENIPVRIYFSQDTYLPILVTVQNSAQSIVEGRRYIRYGCSIDTKTATYDAYKQFVKFLHMYAEQAHRDNGKVTFFYL
ncbi:MAG: PilZ domain-containing protein [Bdellovibrionales bacterium]|nr:PilZ domain-containing protein [Bdellovibrionales bacterium]